MGGGGGGWWGVGAGGSDHSFDGKRGIICPCLGKNISLIGGYK